MLTTGPDGNAAVWRHLRSYFAGHEYRERVWSLGPAKEELPALQVAEFSPGPKSSLWVYASVGSWAAREDPRLEFILTAPTPNARHVELVTIAAWYHGRHGLGLGHTVPIGEPWLPGSICEYLLVSMPYPFGPELEVCSVPNGHVHVYWLLPITAAERDFKIHAGQEALEQRFDGAGLQYWNPLRASVIE